MRLCPEVSFYAPKDPVSLTVWHYYNGSQQAAFDALVEEFNDTVGQEKGIYAVDLAVGKMRRDSSAAMRPSSM